MNVNTITSKILSMENELEILRMTIKELFRIKTSKKTENFAALYNIFKGKGKFTEQEIKDAKIKLSDFT